MKVCPHCHKDLPEDSIFCIYCGKPVDEIIEDDKKSKKEKKLKKNSRENNFSKLGLLLFFIGLIGCDFILGTVLNATNGNTSIAFMISFVLYILSFACGVASLLVDRSDVKKGFEPTGNKGFAYACICLSLYITLINLSQGLIF